MEQIQLHRVARDHLPNLPIQEGCMWLAILHPSYKDLKDVKERTAFQWIKCHAVRPLNVKNDISTDSPQNVCVRTIKHSYFGRHPIAGFEIWHRSYSLGDEEQVKDIQRNHSYGGNVIALRALEPEDAAAERRLISQKLNASRIFNNRLDVEDEGREVIDLNDEDDEREAEIDSDVSFSGNDGSNEPEPGRGDRSNSRNPQPVDEGIQGDDISDEELHNSAATVLEQHLQDPPLPPNYPHRMRTAIRKKVTEVFNSGSYFRPARFASTNEQNTPIGDITGAPQDVEMPNTPIRAFASMNEIVHSAKTNQDVERSAILIDDADSENCSNSPTPVASSPPQQDAATIEDSRNNADTVPLSPGERVVLREAHKELIPVTKPAISLEDPMEISTVDTSQPTDSIIPNKANEELAYVSRPATFPTDHFAPQGLWNGSTGTTQLQTRVDQLSMVAQIALHANGPWTNCGICKKTMHLQPWTQFDFTGAPLCEFDSRAWLRASDVPQAVVEQEHDRAVEDLLVQKRNLDHYQGISQVYDNDAPPRRIPSVTEFSGILHNPQMNFNAPAPSQDQNARPTQPVAQSTVLPTLGFGPIGGPMAQLTPYQSEYAAAYAQSGLSQSHWPSDSPKQRGPDKVPEQQSPNDSHAGNEVDVRASSGRASEALASQFVHEDMLEDGTAGGETSDAPSFYSAEERPASHMARSSPHGTDTLGSGNTTDSAKTERRVIKLRLGTSLGMSSSSGSLPAKAPQGKKRKARRVLDDDDSDYEFVEDGGC